MRASPVLCCALLLTLLAACQQGSDPTSPGARDLATAKRKGGGSGSGGSSTLVDVSGGFVSSSPQAVNLSVTGRTATMESPFGAPITLALSSAIPNSGHVNWGDCVWNADIGPFSLSNPDPVVLQKAKDLWDRFLTTQSTAQARHFSASVNRKADGRMDERHQMRAWWFTWKGASKYMWEVEAGAETNLSLILPVGTWDGSELEITGGILRMTRTYCGEDPSPEGCIPARGVGNRPTVVCRNDGPAFPKVPFRATLQP